MQTIVDTIGFNINIERKLFNREKKTTLPVLTHQRSRISALTHQVSSAGLQLGASPGDSSAPRETTASPCRLSFISREKKTKKRKA